MLERLIILLERLQSRLDYRQERKQRARSLRCAKQEIARLAKMRVI